MSSREMSADGRTVTIERADKLLFPEAGITKGGLAEYYRRMAERMLRYMGNRPVTMHRFPDGIHGSGFYQKEAPAYFPGWIRRVSIHVAAEDGEQEQIVCDDGATLLYLANQACITPHIWLSRADRLHHPDRLIFDLDPPDDDFDPIRRAAQELRALLADVGLTSHVMTTGSRGLHVVVPLDRSAAFDTVRDFAHDLAELLAQRHPERVTTAQRKEKRGGRLFLDYLRNAYAQTSVAPYAVRPLPRAPVATPLAWDELDRPDMNAQRYSVSNIFRRLGQKSDPWAGMLQRGQSLTGARRRLDEARSGRPTTDR